MPLIQRAGISTLPEAELKHLKDQQVKADIQGVIFLLIMMRNVDNGP